MRFILLSLVIMLLAVLLGTRFFLVLGAAAYAFILFLMYKMIVFHVRVLRAGRSAEHYSERLVGELRALVRVIHVLKAKKR